MGWKFSFNIFFCKRVETQNVKFIIEIKWKLIKNIYFYEEIQIFISTEIDKVFMTKKHIKFIQKKFLSSHPQRGVS